MLKNATLVMGWLLAILSCQAANVTSHLIQRPEGPRHYLLTGKFAVPLPERFPALVAAAGPD
jgi:hypothetical protein